MILPGNRPERQDDPHEVWNPPPSVDREVLRKAALAYYDLGWCIIPIRHKDASGKQPACRWKEFQSVRPTRDQTANWLRRSDLHGLAVICGSVSGGLTCRDFDTNEEYDVWTAENPALARKLPTAITCRGRHVYFRSQIRQIIPYPHGELRGAGYCLLPPSIHPSGSVYGWADEYDLTQIPEVDPIEVGLALRDTEKTEKAEKTEDIEVASTNHHSAFSALSVSPQIRTQIEEAIRATQPSGIGQRYKAVFKFARLLKGICALADAPNSALRPFVVLWHRQALPVVSTKPFEDTWLDFVRGWNKVKFPAGTGPFAEIVKRADARELPAIAMQYDAPETRRLVAICCELQLSAGTGVFYLSCRTAAGILNIKPMTAWRRLQVLCVDGILEIIEPGTTTRATRYVYSEGTSLE